MFEFSKYALKNAMDEQSETVHSLAQKTGLSRTVLYKLLDPHTPSNPTVSTISILTDVLAIPPYTLFRVIKKES